MRWASVVSEREASSEAITEAIDSVRRALGGDEPDLLLVYVTPHHAAAYDALPAALCQAFPRAHLLGCSGASVIGDGHEIEGAPAVALSAAVLPDVEVRPFVIEHGVPGIGSTGLVGALREQIGLDPDLAPALVVLTDPFTVRADTFGRAMDEAYPSSAKIGGLASGGVNPGECVLFVDGRTLRAGAVGVALTGDVEMLTVVAQGCLPVGADMRVTQMDGALVTGLDGMDAFLRLQKAIEDLEPSARVLLTRGPMIGVAMDPQASALHRGDYLVRQLVGGDPARGAISIAHPLKLGDVVRLHVRDAATSTEDLHELLARQSRSGAVAALMFSCVGRGREFHGEPDHDVRAVRSQLGPIPVGGFFCNGELGPVHGRTFLHSWTSSIGLIRTREWS
jgi:small ligand-binding sensory domain FIST